MAQPKTIRELLVKLGVTANTKPVVTFDKAITAARTNAFRLVKALAAAATAASGAAVAVFGLATHTALAASNVGTAASRVGVHVEALQELLYAADNVNVASEQLEAALVTQGKNAAAAAVGAGEASDAYRVLGVRVRNENGTLRGQIDLFMETAEALSRVSDTTLRAQYAMKIFGEGGVRLLPLFEGGAKGIEELRQRARDLGIVFGKDSVEAASAYSTVLTEAKAVMVGLKNEIGMAFLPIVNDAVTAFRDWSVANRDLIRQNLDKWAKRIQAAIRGAVGVFWQIDRAVRQTIGSWEPVIVAALVAFGALFGLLGSVLAISAIASVLSGLAAIGALVGGGLLAGIGVLTAAVAGLVTWLAMLIIPATALYLVLDDLFTYFRGGESAIGAFLDAAEERGGVLGTFAGWLRAIVDAMRAAWEWAGKLWEKFKGAPLESIKRVAGVLGRGSVVGAVASAARRAHSNVTTGLRTAGEASQRTVSQTHNNTSVQVPITINNPDPEAAGAAVRRHVESMTRGAAAAFDGGDL